MTKLIYLASPYSHDDPRVVEARFRAACMAAAELMLRGYVVFSPIAHSHPVAEHGGIDPTHDFNWLSFDLPLLARCDEVRVLCIPGAVESIGIKAEVTEALRLGIPVQNMLPSDAICKVLAEAEGAPETAYRYTMQYQFDQLHYAWAAFTEALLNAIKIRR